MPVILSTSNIIIDNGITNFTMETVKSLPYIEKDTVGTTSNLLAEPIVESVSRMYPPVRSFEGTNIYPVSIAGGNATSFFLTNDGKVYGCGNGVSLGNNFTDRNVPTLITSTTAGGTPTAFNNLKISAIVCARYNSLFLTENGKVYAAGSGYYGETGLGQVDAAVPTLITATTVGGTPTDFNNLTI